MGLFEKFWAIGAEALNELKKPLIKGKIQRKIRASIDDCLNQKIDADSELTKILSEKLEDIDINKVLSLRQTKIAADTTIEELKSLYKDMFEEEIVVA